MLVTTVCSWGVIVLSVIMLVLVGLFIVEAALVSGVSAGEAWFIDTRVAGRKLVVLTAR